MRSIAIFTILFSGLVYGQKALPVSANSDGTAHANPPPQKDWREKLIGNQHAPLKVVAFFDYQSSACASTIPALLKALKGSSPQAQLILKHDPLSIHPDAFLAHQAALVAGEQGKFWQMNDLLFAHQQKSKLPDLLEYARQLGLNVPLFQKRLRSGYFKGAIDQDQALAQSLGVESTPTIFINGRKLAGKQTEDQLFIVIEGRSTPAASGAGSSFIADLDLSRSPSLGPADAPITIVEFSDFQCPYCARVIPTLRTLMAQYPTQIKWVFKNFPLDFHADSRLAHQAVLAAGKQGKFWEMHDLVFANQGAIKRNDLLQKARLLNLDIEEFSADMESEGIKNQIESDRKSGAAMGLNATPTFYINSVQYSGAMPLEQFKSAINKELAAVGRPVPVTISTEVPAVDHSPNSTEISLGSPDSPITLTWFSDLQSSLSLKATLLVRKLIDSHPGQIRLVFKNRPLENHPGAMLLHEAAMAANDQGKFWQMHDLIIANSQKATRQDLIAYAKSIGLDLDRFQKDVDSGRYRPLIEADLREAQRRAVLGSPVFFLNSARIDGVQNEKLFNDIIDGQLAAKK
jgi:protein-disulfide isomerase